MAGCRECIHFDVCELAWDSPSAIACSDFIGKSDVVPVVHGRWEPHYETVDPDPDFGIVGGDFQTGWQCSVCGRYEWDKEPYCNCGALMDGGAK